MEPHMNPTHLTRASLASPCRRGGVLTVLVVIAALAAAHTVPDDEYDA